MSRIFTIAQMIVSVLLVIVIMLQSRGGGLSNLFGGGGEIYHTKRGLEKFIFISTIVLSILFIGLGVAHLITD